MEKYNILMIDDEQIFCENVCEYLTLRGFENCDYATDIESAIKLLKKGRYDLITLDVNLGADSGLEQLSAIMHIYSGPVIFLSCISDTETKLSALRKGGADYLIKPIDLEELYLRANIMIENFRKQNGKEYGDYTICVEPKAVKIRGNVVNLGSTGLRLLLFFLENPNVIHSREHLYEQIWGGEYVYSSRVVDTAIAYIRRATGDKNLKTIRNQGYMYVTSNKCVEKTK